MRYLLHLVSAEGFICTLSNRLFGVWRGARVSGDHEQSARLDQCRRFPRCKAGHPPARLSQRLQHSRVQSALSPFIRKLVRDCDVAGAIGTEIPVFELLAGEMAFQFPSRFLDGQAAGKALLESRRDPLARGDPLGLAYTLYAVAELTPVQ